MARIIKNTFGNFFVILVVFSLVTGWMFSGWPQVWQNLAVPPEIQKAEAAAEDVLYILASSSSVVYEWEVPPDWNSASNSIEVIGGGGGGDGLATNTGNGGGGGGGYSKITNQVFVGGTTIGINIGVGGATSTNGGDTMLCSTTTACASSTDTNVMVGAQGGRGATSLTGAQGAATTTSATGTVMYRGGNGGLGNLAARAGGGGGGLEDLLAQVQMVVMPIAHQQLAHRQVVEEVAPAAVQPVPLLPQPLQPVWPEEMAPADTEVEQEAMEESEQQEQRVRVAAEEGAMIVLMEVPVLPTLPLRYGIRLKVRVVEEEVRETIRLLCLLVVMVDYTAAAEEEEEAEPQAQERRG